MYSGKIKSNAVVTHVIASPDGIAKFVITLTAASSPSNTDERVAANQFDMDLNGLVRGGLMKFLEGPLKTQGLLPGELPFHDFFVRLLLDKGKFSLHKMSSIQLDNGS